jgi:hypothetical protein
MSSRDTFRFNVSAFQAAAGYIYSSIFDGSGGNHRTLFMIGAGAFFLILIVDLVGSRFHQSAVAK